jgi:hypothetical protein
MKPAYGVGLSYRPWLASRCDNPTPKPTSSPNQGLKTGPLGLRITYRISILVPGKHLPPYCCIKYTTWNLKTAVNAYFEPRTLPLLIHLFSVVRESLRTGALKIQNTEVKGYRATTLIGILTSQAEGEGPCFVL